MDDLVIEAVTPDKWDALVLLFGANGAYSNCWCTWWLLTAKEWDEATKQQRRRLLESEVHAGRVPGLLAYRDGQPVGWCAVGPRERYRRLNSPRSRVYRPIDDLETWVVNCFFIRKDERGQGVAAVLLAAGIDHALQQGATVLEAYPIDRAVRPAGSSELFVGSLRMFQAAGFEEVARVNDRPLVRCFIGDR